MKHLFLATLVGAIIAFAWGYVSWEVLSWHEMGEFKDGKQVAETLKSNVSEHDVYVYPSSLDGAPDTKALTEGPFIYAVVRPEPLLSPWRMTASLMRSFVIQLLGSFIIALMIFRIRATRYISRASVGFIMGLFAGLMMTLPTWNWFELPDHHTLAYAADPVIAWTLAGAAIAAIIRPKKARRLFS